MDEQHQDEKFFRERRLGKIFLYFELAYVLVLFWAVQFDFKLFAHLLVGQFFVVLIYFITGWIYGIYLKKTGKAPIDEREKETLREKLSYRFTSKFWYRFLEIITIFLSLGVALRMFAEFYNDIFTNANAIDVKHTLIGYVAFACFFLLVFSTVDILMGWRRKIRNISITNILIAVFLIIVWPVHWLNFSLAIAASLLVLFLFYQNKI